MAKWLMTAALVLSATGSVLAQEPQCVIPRLDLVSPQVRAVVTPVAGGFEYTNAVTNKADAQQRLVMFAVEALTTPAPTQTSPPAWEAAGPIRGSS